MVTGSSTLLSAFGLKKALVVSKFPERLDNPGMKSWGFDAPLTWQVPQLMPAFRAAAPKVNGELNARFPSLER